MSFETKGQDFAAKAGTAAVMVAVYAAAILGCMYLIKYCGPEPVRDECVCNCGVDR
jgi:hypothetical protein